MASNFIKLPVSILNNPRYGLMPDWIWRANIELMYSADKKTGRIEGPDDVWPCTSFDLKSIREVYDYLCSVGIMSRVGGIWYHDDAREFNIICSEREPISKKLRRAIMERDDYSCRYCGAPAEHIDHVFPVARGGDNDPANLVASCAKCNMTKKAHTPDEVGMVLIDLEDMR